MESNPTRSKSHAKIKAVVMVILTISLLFISANYIFSHTISAEKSVISPQQVIVLSNETFLNHQQDLLLTNDSYYVLPPVNVGFGRLTVDWDSSFGFGVYIFSKEQFDHFQAIFPSISHSNVVVSSASEWANKSGFTYEAAEWGAATLGHPLYVSYNVTQTGNYYVAITDGMYGGAISHYANDKVYFINEWFSPYSYQTQNVTTTVVVQEKDNLYLYIGLVLLALAMAILLFLVTLALRHRKTASLSK